MKRTDNSVVCSFMFVSLKMAIRMPQWIFQAISKTSRRSFHSTSTLATFYEPNKSNYPIKHDGVPNVPRQTILNQILGGYKFLKEEIKLYLQELKERNQTDFLSPYKENETIIVHQFSTATDLCKWVVTTDSDYNEGYSTASLELSDDGTGIFSGNLCTKRPKDGKIKVAGYCNIRTVTKYKSFKRPTTFKWHPSNHLVLRVRGDGRSYSINLHTKGYFDVTWNDTYHYPMYTAGGPYWQVIKIPFSKFVFSSKGTVQDKQPPLDSNAVTHIGFTIADKVNGPFKLEIDYIGIEFNPNHFEETAYETYRYTDVKM